MHTLAVQYLQSGPHLAAITPQAARAKLQETFERLPITHVLLGWGLPDTLTDACKAACERAGVPLYRWQPVLTGDGQFQPAEAWRTVGLTGERSAGFHDVAEFAFLCSNHPQAQDAVLAHMRAILHDGRYDGVFLDRIRYNSPALHPAREFGCFCTHCQRAAAREGLALEAVRAAVLRLLQTPSGVASFVAALFGQHEAHASPEVALLRAFLDFRERSVTRVVQRIAAMASEQDKAVGLDCFSPTLTRMVGQNLAALGQHSAWIKIMSYAHTLGPAGIPFELLGLADWLCGEQGWTEARALELLARAADLPLPNSRRALREQGLSPAALRTEVQHAKQAGVSVVLAGIELVEVAGVTHLHPQQIAADLAALRSAEVNGLVLSWDLWDIPLAHLERVAHVCAG